jgi:glucokinase
MNAVLVGVDVGGTKTAVVLGTVRGEILWRTQFATEAGRGFHAVYSDILASIARARQVSEREVLALSVSIGGPLEVLRGIIKSPPHLPGWDDIPLKRLLSEDVRLPVYIEHDGNAGALAEFYFGAGKGFRNIIFLTMGTGFGAGLILDGKLYRGTTDVAGEAGHIRIAEDGPLCYGKRGSLEGFGSGTGIVLLSQMMYPGKYLGGVTVQDLYREFQNGGSEARQVFERAAFHLGRGLAMMADLLNPERILLGGIGMRIFDALVEPALRVFESETLPEARRACAIVPASLGEEIGDYASLCAALEQGGLLDEVKGTASR